jgi:GT2 family glycosyltransferase
MVNNANGPEIGIVVPTIGGRPEYLPLALRSITEAGERHNTHILLVGNKGFDASEFLAQNLIDEYRDEPEPGLAAKINWAFSQLPPSVKFINWIGDDDLYTPGAITAAYERISQKDQPVLVFGGCEYIDPKGTPIFTNKAGQWAVPLLRFGPQLIPQPGALYRRDAFEKVGGLSTEFGWAFDFNLFLSLSKIGRCVYLGKTLAKFRWHPGSLSVSRRRESVREASAVRKAHLPKWLRPISPLWDYPVQQATYWAGVRVSKRLR